MIQKIINIKIIILILISFSIAVLGHQQEVNAQSSSSSSVTEPGSGVGILTCPIGEIHKVAIAFEATSTGPSSAIGDWDISTHSASGDVFKSGTILGGHISPSGQFTLTGQETGDNICGSIVPSVSIKIIGQCVTGGSAGGLTTVKFRASNGEKADFPSSPTCYGTTS